MRRAVRGLGSVESRRVVQVRGEPIELVGRGSTKAKADERLALLMERQDNPEALKVYLQSAFAEEATVFVDELQRQDRAFRASGRFSSVAHALSFYFERVQTMTSPKSSLPVGELGPDGDRHVVMVDGGRGGDAHEAHCLLITIGTAWVRCQREMPVEAECLRLHVAEGWKLAEIAKKAQCAESTASRRMAAAETYLRGSLQEARIVRGRAA